MPNEKIVNRKHLARQQRERIQTRNITLAAIAVIVLVIGVIGYGILNEQVLIPNRAIATVNGEKISLSEFQMQARYTRYNIVSQYIQYYQFAQMFGNDEAYADYFNQYLIQIASQLDTATVGQAVLDGLIEDRLIRAEAKKRGITVSPEEVELALGELFSYFPNGTPTSAPTYAAQPTSTLSATQLALVPPTQTPTLEPTAVITQTAVPTEVVNLPSPTPSEPTATATPYTEEAYKKEFTDTIGGLEESIQVTEKDLRRIYESILLRSRLSEAITADTPNSTEQVWARHILVSSEVTATLVLEKLEAGEDFATLATAYSIDTGSSVNGGDLGWFGTGQMVEEFETAAFGLEIGEISAPIKSQFGWHIIQVLGHENKTLSESEYNDLLDQKFQTWLDEQRAASEVVIDENWILEVPAEPTIPAEFAITTAN
ncbi:MAG: peptidylprolyl isomerase [Anaerolineales bacterium]|jgi:parvulin-like peptidyl-prolyl isomerase|nr:peptidylprolyl isomerase [Anaerolineales bacterium]